MPLKTHTNLPKNRLAHSYQSTIPHHTALNQKLGINHNARVFFFAGAMGDWARALSHSTRLTFSDIDSTRVNMSKSNPWRIKRFLTVAGELFPRRKKRFDWSVSYEPYPMKQPGKIKQTDLRGALVRSLLNQKGAKLIVGTTVNAHWQRNGLFEVAQSVAEEFGAQASQKLVKIKLKRSANTSFSEEECAVITLSTNDSARTKAIDYLSK